MFDLTGKTALVTGATGGIGSGIARALHQAGAQLALSGRREDKLRALQDDLGERAFIFSADLGKEGEAEALVKNVTADLGGADILVNNAGLTRDNLALRLKEEDWREVLDVNLTAPFFLARAGLKAMMKKRWGRIINITSIVGATGNPGQTNYAAAKAGMAGWTKSLAAEVAVRGITVNCIAPGFIETAMTDALEDAQKQKLQDSIPAGRLGQVSDIAAAAVYLASEEAGYVTGATLHVNGGMAML